MTLIALGMYNIDGENILQECRLCKEVSFIWSKFHDKGFLPILLPTTESALGRSNIDGKNILQEYWLCNAVLQGGEIFECKFHEKSFLPNPPSSLTPVSVTQIGRSSHNKVGPEKCHLLSGF